MTARRTTHLLATATLGLVIGLAGCGSDADETPSPAAEESTSQAPVELTVPTGETGRCVPPNAETLQGFDSAFEGTVTEVADGTATLEVDEWFKGDGEADTVTVTAPSEDLQALLAAVDFQEGRTYLVSSTNGRVTLCGFTAESTPELEALYAEAFGQ